MRTLYLYLAGFESRPSVFGSSPIPSLKEHSFFSQSTIDKQ